MHRLLAICLLTLTACTGQIPSAWQAKVDQQAGLFAAVAQQIKRAKVNDAAYTLVQGFPHLRTSRFAIAASPLLDTPEKRQFWLEYMQRLGEEGVAREIARLPANSLHFLLQRFEAKDRAALVVKAGQAGRRLLAQMHDDDAQWLRTHLGPATEYQAWRAWIGLYPLFYIPAHIGIAAWQRDVRRMRQSSLTMPVLYAPATKMNADIDVAAWLARISRNALQLPLPAADADAHVVIRRFAPTWLTDGHQEHDRIGSIQAPDGKAELRPDRATTYVYFSHALIGNLPHLQINYVIWFSRRISQGTLDLTAGKWDGITLRVTLGWDGHPVMYDAMTNCGCYHTFFPVRGKVLAARKVTGVDPAFVAHWLDGSDSLQSLALRLQPGNHRVLALIPPHRLPKKLNATIHYVFQPYHTLEALPTGRGHAVSLFDHQGLLPGSERPERIVFFSFGIPNVGAMRQRGHHATAFIGRRHFDDAHLLERYFTFAMPKKREK